MAYYGFKYTVRNRDCLAYKKDNNGWSEYGVEAKVLLTYFFDAFYKEINPGATENQFNTFLTKFKEENKLSEDEELIEYGRTVVVPFIHDVYTVSSTSTLGTAYVDMVAGVMEEGGYFGRFAGTSEVSERLQRLLVTSYHAMYDRREDLLDVDYSTALAKREMTFGEGDEAITELKLMIPAGSQETVSEDVNEELTLSVNSQEPENIYKVIKAKVLDIRSGRPLTDCPVKKIVHKVGDDVKRTLAFGYDLSVWGSGGGAALLNKRDGKWYQGNSTTEFTEGKSSQIALRGLGYNTGRPSTDYGPTGRRVYNQFLTDRGAESEHISSGNPPAERLQQIIAEYNRLVRDRSDRDGRVRLPGQGTISIPVEKYLLMKGVKLELGFHDFPIVLEQLKKHSNGENGTISRSTSAESSTGFHVEWNDSQGIEWGDDFGWVVGTEAGSDANPRANFANLKVSETLEINGEGNTYTGYSQLLSQDEGLSRFFANAEDDPHFVLFGMKWCQPVYDNFADPTVAGGITDNTYQQDLALANLNMHLVTMHIDLSGSQTYGGKGYGLIENRNSGTQWRGSGGHKGIDLHAAVGDPVFAVHGGLIHNKRSSGCGYYTKLQFEQEQGLPQGPNPGGMAYLHLSEFQFDLTMFTEKKRVLSGTVIGLAGRTGNFTSTNFYSSTNPTIWAGHVHIKYSFTGDNISWRSQVDSDNRKHIPCNDLPMLFPCKCEVTLNQGQNNHVSNCQFEISGMPNRCWAVAELKCPYMAEKRADEFERSLQAQLRYIWQNVSPPANQTFRNPGNGFDGSWGNGSKNAIKRFRTIYRSDIYGEEDLPEDAVLKAVPENSATDATLQKINELAPIQEPVDV